MRTTLSLLTGLAAGAGLTIALTRYIRPALWWAFTRDQR